MTQRKVIVRGATNQALDELDPDDVYASAAAGRTALGVVIGTDVRAQGSGDPTLASLGAVPTSRTVTAGTGLTGGGDLSANRSFAPDFGTGAGKVTEGNDSRLTDSRAPNGAAGGDLSGTYPNPSVVDDSHAHTASTAPGSGGATFLAIAKWGTD